MAGSWKIVMGNMFHGLGQCWLEKQLDQHRSPTWQEQYRSGHRVHHGNDDCERKYKLTLESPPLKWDRHRMPEILCSAQTCVKNMLNSSYAIIKTGGCLFVLF